MPYKPSHAHYDEILADMLPEEIEVHDSCGSEKLEHRRWVNLNTGEIFGDDGTDDVFCNKCEKIIHTSEIISQAAYDVKEGFEKTK